MAMKTPGVYIVEKNAFSTSVVEVETAVPAFIGYTEKAMNGTESLTNKPWKISSMTEYINYFGGAPNPLFSIDHLSEKPYNANTENVNKDIPGVSREDEEPEKKTINIETSSGVCEIEVENDHTLYYNMLLFFANGGGPCYIVSVGDHATDLSKDVLIKALIPLEKEKEPTMIVVPEAVNLPLEECINVQQQMLEHCTKMKNRFAILDVRMKRYEENQCTENITNFRNNIGDNNSYGGAYYPWLATSLLSDNDIPFTNFIFKKSVRKFFASLGINEDIQEFIENNTEENDIAIKKELHQALLQNLIPYQQLFKAIKEIINLLPPSAAMAGIYTKVDHSRGVWKAPANISINSVVKPTEILTNEQQEDMNMPLNGKAVNAIRSFIGEGIKVWGARTLDGNSQDWRYINVRRTLIYLEESIKNAARSYVFEPNDGNTWLNMKCMIENFLRSVWKRGGLAGAIPEDAYSVHVGLGDTMTPEDILDGVMRITVLVAVSHPAEFIEITFQQQMQKS